MGWIENIIRDWKTKRWIKKHNKIADDAVQYLSSVGWHGFTGHDKEGRKWIVTGELYAPSAQMQSNYQNNGE
tara:strand:+ start:147 stop:362 length:216 start_codon:yes stop_codon:yes gene_type:complete